MLRLRRRRKCERAKRQRSDGEDFPHHAHDNRNSFANRIRPEIGQKQHPNGSPSSFRYLQL
jgi:hypothetical protein